MAKLGRAGVGSVRVARRPPSAARSAVEFGCLLTIALLLSGAFVVEAYIVPTGSMAPTLLGAHADLRCPSCGARFPVGADPDGRIPRPACPNCGRDDLAGAEVARGGGDRLLVHKHAFDVRPPRRWEVAVFQGPGAGGQAFVKRVVGLPGESVQVRGGDVWVDGRIARKSLAEQRAVRLLVHDNDHADPDGPPRWAARVAGDGGWSRSGPGFVHEPTSAASRAIDWLEYRHVRPDRRAPGAVFDFVAYNGLDVPAEDRVADLMVEADLSGLSTAGLSVRLGPDGGEWVVRLPTIREGEPPEAVVRYRGRFVPSARTPGPAEVGAILRRPSAHLLASWCDRRLMVTLDGVPLFAPIQLDDGPSAVLGVRWQPPALGVDGSGRARVDGLRVYRDVYYTDSLAYQPVRPAGVDAPVALGPGEYFVLGDNSPISSDSRFWPGGPVVAASGLLGKPFLVHLPSRSVPVRAFGREVYRIPDPRQIRYIR